ncbi:MAG: hypothetical protein QOG15_1991 [Solirubrobacteraceae bacterium]|nr:hypothetical protein [Solirubrobacteraceae bacterium]
MATATICLADVGTVDRKQELFDSIVRLRRAGRELPGNRDIAAVRAALERELGETVSRRLAARVLGVSHTALDRWIKAGDLPLVYSPRGRVEVPVPALLELYEAVEADRADGHRRYALTPTMARRREAARRLRVDDVSGVGEREPHERARARSLAYHRAVARRLRKPMVDEARHVLFRWREQGRIDERYADRWEHLLTRPLPDIREALVDKRQEADDLRQNSPFAGVLSEPERRRIAQEIS